MQALKRLRRAGINTATHPGRILIRPLAPGTRFATSSFTHFPAILTAATYSTATTTAMTTSAPQRNFDRSDWEKIANASSEACLAYVKEHATRGDPASIIDTIEKFTETNHMMNVGPTKGAFVDEVIRKKTPLVMAELGSYTGYSAVRFASLQRQVTGNNSSHYYAFEFNPVYAERVREMVDFAGLSDQVTVTVGPFSENYHILKGKTVDIYFIDHEKSIYLSDAKLIVESGTLAPGSILAADNVIRPGAPDYLEYVENSGLFSTERHYGQPGRDGVADAISIATYLGENKS